MNVSLNNFVFILFYLIIFCLFSFYNIFSVANAMDKKEKLSGEEILKTIGNHDQVIDLDGLLRQFYLNNYSNIYKNYDMFIKSSIMTPDLLYTSNFRLIGNENGINYGPYYLRYFIIFTYYDRDIIDDETKCFINSCLINNKESIKYGVETSDGKQFSAALPKTLSDIIYEKRNR